MLDIDSKVEKKLMETVTGNLIDARDDYLAYQKDDIDPNSEELRGESTTTEPPFIVGLREILLRINDKKINVKNLQQ